jgi:glycosyltransferase involved in cell wall biosynthesis
MRHPLIDVTRLCGRFLNRKLPTGVDRVSLAYVEHYGGEAQAVVRWAGRSFILRREASDRIFDLLLHPTEAFRADAWAVLAKSFATGWVERRSTGRFLFNTGHSGLEQRSYPTMLQRQQVKPLFLVHDLIPLTHPEYCRAGERQRHQRRMNHTLDFSAGVIANSRSTLDQLTAYACDAGKRMPPAISAPLAPPGLVHMPPGGRPIDERYFVMLGTIEPRKNHWLILQIWRRLAERLGARAPRLVLIGQRGWECENVVDLLDRCEPLRGLVTEHPACSDAKLTTYLTHAQALLFPSFAEGYGMPVVEALALKLPVIASDLPSFREIAGDIPEYLDPLDGRRWGELIAAYAEPDSPMRAAQMSRIAHFETPTWAAHFSKVDDLMVRLSEPV